jgi:hypothetical protein
MTRAGGDATYTYATEHTAKGIVLIELWKLLLTRESKVAGLNYSFIDLFPRGRRQMVQDKRYLERLLPRGSSRWSREYMVVTQIHGDRTNTANHPKGVFHFEIWFKKFASLKEDRH